MELSRRGFFKVAGVAGAGVAAAARPAELAVAGPGGPAGVPGRSEPLHRLPQMRAGLSAGEPSAPAGTALRRSACRDKKRRPDERTYTVINRYYPGRRDERDQLVPTFVKIQCMHCNDPACASACIVRGA